MEGREGREEEEEEEEEKPHLYRSLYPMHCLIPDLVYEPPTSVSVRLSLFLSLSLSFAFTQIHAPPPTHTHTQHAPSDTGESSSTDVSYAQHLDTLRMVYPPPPSTSRGTPNVFMYSTHAP